MTEQQKPKKPRICWSASEICDQVAIVADWISHGKRPHQIRNLCAETWDLSYRTSESRIQAARRAMVTDMEGIDRKELAAQAMQTLLKVQEMSLDTRQGSNAIGATRLLMELAGILGRSA